MMTLDTESTTDLFGFGLGANSAKVTAELK